MSSSSNAAGGGYRALGVMIEFSGLCSIRVSWCERSKGGAVSGSFSISLFKHGAKASTVSTSGGKETFFDLITFFLMTFFFFGEGDGVSGISASRLMTRLITFFFLPGD